MFGFKQEELLKYDLNIEDALLLSWFLIKGKNKMLKRKIINNKIFFGIKYEKVLEDLPILKANTKRTIARRFDKLVEKGLISKHIDKKAGNKTYFSPELRIKTLFKKYNEGEVLA